MSSWATIATVSALIVGPLLYLIMGGERFGKLIDWLNNFFKKGR